MARARTAARGGRQDSARAAGWALHACTMLRICEQAQCWGREWLERPGSCTSAWLPPGAGGPAAQRALYLFATWRELRDHLHHGRYARQRPAAPHSPPLWLALPAQLHLPHCRCAHGSHHGQRVRPGPGQPAGTSLPEERGGGALSLSASAGALTGSVTTSLSLSAAAGNARMLAAGNLLLRAAAAGDLALGTGEFRAWGALPARPWQRPRRCWRAATFPPSITTAGRARAWRP